MNNQKIDNRLLFGQYNKEKYNNGESNNLVNDNNEILSSDPSLIFFSEGLEYFSIIAKFFKNNNNSMNIIENKEFHDIKNIESNETIIKLNLDLKKEKEINNELNSKIKELEELLKDKEKEITDETMETDNLIKKINNNIKNISNNNKIIELKDKKEEKEKEMKELNQIFPFEYEKRDKIFTVTFITLNEDIHYSMACKNTDIFNRLEDAFYDKYPEFKASNTYFLIHDKIIDKSNNLEANNIIDNDFIIVKSKINE